MPEVRAIDLSNNKLLNVDPLNVEFRCKVTNVQVLQLNDNRLGNISYVEKLRGMNLTKLSCSNNPFKDKLGAEEYTDTMRGLFPGLQTLDNMPVSSVPPTNALVAKGNLALNNIGELDCFLN